jgi:hypothetical protein
MDTLQFVLDRYHITPENWDTMPIPLRGAQRTHLGPLFCDLGFTVGAEIGVWKGHFSEVLLKANPGLHMYCVDPWVSYKAYIDHTRHDLIAGAYEEAQKRLSQYPATIIRKFSVDAANDLPDGSLDFVYIDGNHSFQDVVNDLCVWSKKVRVGGIISGHDYKTFRPDLNIHVVEAVQGFVAANDITPWFVLGRAKVRRSEYRDAERSFLWVNPPPGRTDEGQLFHALEGAMSHGFHERERVL